jgi:hypothetical protein
MKISPDFSHCGRFATAGATLAASFSAPAFAADEPDDPLQLSSNSESNR